MNTLPLIPDDLPSRVTISCPTSPSPAMECSDSTTFSRKISSGKSVIIDPYFNMDCTAPTRKRQRKDDSNYHDLRNTSPSFLNKPTWHKSLDQSDNFTLRPRLQPLRSSRNIFVDAETSYTPSSIDGPNSESSIIIDDDAIRSSSSLDCDDKRSVCSYYCAEDGDRTINHVLLTPRNQGMWGPSTIPSLVQHRASREVSMEFHVVSPSQPDLPFLPFY